MNTESISKINAKLEELDDAIFLQEGYLQYLGGHDEVVEVQIQEMRDFYNFLEELLECVEDK